MQETRLNITKLSLKKIFNYGASMVVFALALLLVLVIVNYLVVSKTSFYDVTRNQIHSLSQQSQNIAKAVDFPVEITAFYLSGSQHRMDLLFTEYADLNPNITFRLVDPLTQPLIAQEYGVQVPRTIIFTAPGRSTQLDPLPSGTSHTELEITTALYRLITNKERKIYFTTGHGELNIANNQNAGINLLNTRLLQQNFLISTLNLQQTPDVPEDCDLLIIADPQATFTDTETETIAKYQQNGKPVFILISPGIDANLGQITDPFGISFGDNYIYETASDLTTLRGPTSPICMPLDQHEITDAMETLNVIFPWVRSVDIRPLSGVTATRLIASSQNSWAETDFQSIIEMSRSNRRPDRNENEMRGPITVAAVTEAEIIIPAPDINTLPEKVPLRSAYFGSGRFITNEVVNQFPANLDLFVRTVNWITRNDDVLEITPNTLMFTPIELTISERRWISWITLVVFPAAILLVGFVVWLRKR